MNVDEDDDDEGTTEQSENQRRAKRTTRWHGKVVNAGGPGQPDLKKNPKRFFIIFVFVTFITNRKLKRTYLQNDPKIGLVGIRGSDIPSVPVRVPMIKINRVHYFIKPQRALKSSVFAFTPLV